MKKLLLLIGLFISLYSVGQPVPGGGFTPIHNGQEIDWLAGKKYLGIPSGHDTILNQNQRLVPGALFFQTSDSTIYAWNGTKWVKGGGPRDKNPTSGLIIGNSTEATYSCGTEVGTFLLTDADLFAGNTYSDQAVPGNTIQDQHTIFLADPNKGTYDWFIVEIGLNNTNYTTSAASEMVYYQSLINDINKYKKKGAKIIVATMTPARARFIVLYGSTNGATAYAKWLDMNTSIMGGGSFPVTGVDYRINDHTAFLNDGAGNMKVKYDCGDGVHETNDARLLIAQTWRHALNLIGFLPNQQPSLIPFIKPEGTNTNIQVNTNGLFDGTNQYTFNKSTNTVNITGSTAFVGQVNNNSNSTGQMGFYGINDAGSSGGILLNGSAFHTSGNQTDWSNNTLLYNLQHQVIIFSKDTFKIGTGNYNNTPTFVITPQPAGLGAAGNVGVGNQAPSELLTLGTAGTTKGVFSQAGITSQKITVQPSAVAGNWTWTWPTGPGTNTYLLQTDGTGVTSWVPPPSGSSGTVTNFSAGTLSPLFTTSVATPTTTPALTFSLTNAAAHRFFGNFTGSSGAASYSSPTLASADFAGQGTGTTVLHGGAGNPSWQNIVTADIANSNVTYAKIQDITGQTILGRWDAANGATQEITIGAGLALNNSTGVLSSTIAGGTVTNVSGTTNQIDVATGTTTPVISLHSGGTLPGAWALGTPASATLTNATGLPISTGVSGLGTGIATWLATPSSANLAAAITDETGTGKAVFGTTPDITTGFTISGAATSRKIMVGNGTNYVPSTETWAVPGTSGNLLISDGTNWTSAAAPGVITASNGLTKSTNDIQLGGTLTGNTTIAATSAYTLFVTGSNAAGTLKATTTTAYGLFGEATGAGIGVEGIGDLSTSVGGQFYNNSTGYAITGQSVGSVASFSTTPTSTNTSVELLHFVRSAGGSTPADGIGTHMTFNMEYSSGNNSEAARIGSKWSSVSTQAGTLEFSTKAASSTLARRMLISDAGKLTLDNYGSGTFTGTATKYLQVDASGNVIEGALTVPLSKLSAATATNDINNADFAQVWRWNTLSSNTGLSLIGNSTTASNGQEMLSLNLNGTNTNSSVTSYSLSCVNYHNGTSSTNIGGFFQAQNGTNNYAIIVPDASGSVGIGTSAPNASSLVDITSTTLGFLIPRMTTTQRNAVGTPATGLEIFNTTTVQFEFYNGSAWAAVGGSGGSGTVTSVTSATGDATVATTTTTPVITIISAPKLTTTRGIYGNNFDGSAALTQIIASTYGGTGNGFTKFSGASSSEKTYTLPNYSTNIQTESSFVTQTDGATITWDLSASNNGKVTLGGNRTLAFSNPTTGMEYCLEVIQDGTGSRTLTLPSTCYVVNGGAHTITLTTTAGAIDLVYFKYDGSNYFVSYGRNYTN